MPITIKKQEQDYTLYVKKNFRNLPELAAITKSILSIGHGFLQFQSIEKVLNKYKHSIEECADIFGLTPNGVRYAIKQNNINQNRKEKGQT